jgi:hypothetical protein
MLFVALITAGVWMWLDEAGREGWTLAVVGALIVQWCAFALLVALRARPQGLLLGMAGGTLLRLGALGVAGVFVTVRDVGGRADALILGLAGLMFALALLEAGFVRGLNGSRETT